MESSIRNPYFRQAVEATRPWFLRLESKKYAYDIAHAAELALQFVEGKSFSDYVSDPRVRSAVERALQTAGEALAQPSKTDAASASRISEQRRIIAFRNILVHG